MVDSIRCTAPGCKRHLPAEQMWLPERRALTAANGGRRVELADFPKFALCGRHGHLLRKEGVRVYRYTEEVEREWKLAAERQSQAVSWQSFAQRFASQAKPTGNGSAAKRPDFSGVGMGLSRVAKADATKRAVS